MQVRIRLSTPSSVQFHVVALAVSSLLTPCALVAFSLTIWNIAADMRWTTSFFVSTGIFSHWQVWLAGAGLLLLLARLLGRRPSAD